MRCNRCGHDGKTIYVHGHEQCEKCHSVVEDCCQGIMVYEIGEDNYYVQKNKCKLKNEQK